MDTSTRLQISYVALAITVAIALAELVAGLAHIGFTGPLSRVVGVMGLLWAPAFYAVAFYRRRLAQEQQRARPE